MAYALPKVEPRRGRARTCCWGDPVLSRHVPLALLTAGLFVAIRGLGGLVAVMLAGALADRFGEKPVVLTLLAGAGQVADKWYAYRGR